MDGGGSAPEARSTAVMRPVRSHSEAERRRRQRINGHLATLRSLLPATTMMDKARLLGEVVRHVRELKKRVDEDADVAASVVPAEGDELGVEEGEERMRVWVSCADRAGLMGELVRAVGSVVRARVVRAEMATVEGRTKSVLELEIRGDSGEGEDRPAALRAALRSVLTANETGPEGLAAETYKRPRLASRLSTN